MLKLTHGWPAWQVSSSLGFGFRCGFLGLLHMDIVRERLEREYDLDLIITAPSVIYKCQLEDGIEVAVDNPANMPEKRRGITEPFVKYGLACCLWYSWHVGCDNLCGAVVAT